MVKKKCRRRKKGDSEVTKFGEKVTADTLFAKADNSKGFDGSRYAQVMYDLGTDWTQCAPMANHNSREAAAALYAFSGAGKKGKSFYSDSGGELVKAAKELKWCHDTSTPYRFHNNGRIERRIRHVEEGTRTVLLRAGMDPSWWPLAAQHFCTSLNITDKDENGQTPWTRRFGEDNPFMGLEIPFGAAIYFKPPKPLQKRLPKLAPGGVPGVFLGYKLAAGGVWKGDYLCAMLDDFRRLGARKSTKGKRMLPYYRTKEVIYDDESPPFFPLEEEYDHQRCSISQSLVARQLLPNACFFIII